MQNRGMHISGTFSAHFGAFKKYPEGYIIGSIRGDVMKEAFFTFCGAFGSLIAGLFGGWDSAISVLLIFMLIDYITGLIVAGWFKKSPKTKSGGLLSKIGWTGICRKCVTLMLVLVAAQLDVLLDISYVRDGVCIAFILNELVSIVENAGLMGIPLPEALKKAIDLLQESGKNEKK